MWTLDIGIPVRTTVGETAQLRDEITKQFGAALLSATVCGYIDFQMRFVSKVDMLKAKLSVKSYLQQKGFEVIDGEISIKDAYVIAQPVE